MSDMNGKRDLNHFLKLAGLQLRHRLKHVETSEPQAARTNLMRALDALIKEQVPAHEEKTNTRPPTGTVG